MVIHTNIQTGIGLVLILIVLMNLKEDGGLLDLLGIEHAPVDVLSIIIKKNIISF